MQQIIVAKEVEKRKILAIIRKIIKLKLKNYQIVENLIIKIKYLLVRDKIYISRNKNDTFRIEAIEF